MICSLNLGYIIDHPDSYKPNTPLDLHIKISSSPLKQTHVLPYQICLKWYITFPCKKKSPLRGQGELFQQATIVVFVFLILKYFLVKDYFQYQSVKGADSFCACSCSAFIWRQIITL